MIEVSVTKVIVIVFLLAFFIAGIELIIKKWNE
jgi:hypothetical protein